MSFCVRLPLETTQDVTDATLHPFLFAGDGKNEMEKMIHWNQTLFPSRSSQCVSENNAWDRVDWLFKQPSTKSGYVKRYATLRLPKLPHVTTSTDSSNFIFAKYLQPFMQSELSEDLADSRVQNCPKRLPMTEESQPSRSCKSVRISMPKKPESLDGSVKRVADGSKSRRHSSGNGKRIPTEIFKKHDDVKETGTASATAKLGSLSVKDSLTLIRTSVRRLRRTVPVKDRKDEKCFDSQSVPQIKTHSITMRRPSCKKERQSFKNAEKNSRIVRAKLNSLQKKLERTQPESQSQEVTELKK